MQSSTLAKRGWLLLFLIIAAFYLYGLGAFPLVGPDEPRYAEVAREMLARHDLITPTLGGLPWFEKPPLLYWLIMASYRVFGVSEYAARFGIALCALLTGAAVFCIGRQVEASEEKFDSPVDEKKEANNGFRFWSALIFLSSAGSIVFARGASFDIVVTMTITLALAFFIASEVNHKAAATSGSFLLGGFYFSVGLSLLAKGLVGIVIPFGVIGLYFIFRRERPSRQFLLSLLWGLPLATAVAAVWYGPMIARHGWIFVDQFFVQHHFARFITKKYHHAEPFYFYFTILPLLALPWTISFLSALIGARRWDWRGQASRDRLRVFSLAWIVLPLVFFSLSQSKLPAYILPVLPAVALLTGDRLAEFVRRANGRTPMRVTGALAILVAIGGGYYAARKLGVTPTCAGLSAIPVVLGGVALLFWPRLRPAPVLLIAAGTLAACAIAIKCGAPVVTRQYAVRDLIESANARGYGVAPVVQLHSIERTAEFYAAGRLSYGANGEPIKFEGVNQVANAARRTGGPVLVIVPVQYEWQLLQSRLPIQTEVIGDNGRTAMVVVRIQS